MKQIKEQTYKNKPERSVMMDGTGEKQNRWTGR
jgi:hypothetical protein